jgi:hypothetical protein
VGEVRNSGVVVAVALLEGGRVGHVFQVGICYSLYASYSRYLSQWTGPESLGILMRSARCEARVVYSFKKEIQSMNVYRK